MAITKRRKKQVAEGPDLFDDQMRQCEERIAELQNLPEKMRAEQLERERTMPPPDGMEERRRLKKFECQAARSEIRNERRSQGRSMLMLMLLLFATAATISWVVSFADR